MRGILRGVSLEVIDISPAVKLIGEKNTRVDFELNKRFIKLKHNILPQINLQTMATEGY